MGFLQITPFWKIGEIVVIVSSLGVSPGSQQFSSDTKRALLDLFYTSIRVFHKIEAAAK
jgi:hypothetical protein